MGLILEPAAPSLTHSLHPLSFTITPPSLCTFHMGANGRFPRIIITRQALSHNQSATQKYTSLSSFSDSCLTYHTVATSLSPKAAEPHLAVPEWAASALAMLGPSAAPDSCVCLSAGPAQGEQSQPFKACKGSRCWRKWD